MIKRNRTLSFIVLMLVLPSALAEVKVSIDRNPVQVNESFQLIYSLDHDPDHNPDFSILQQHFIILGTKRSNNISIINGKYQRSVKWNLQLMAKQIGEFTVPAIRFDQQRSEPFQVTVKPSSLASVPHDQLIFEVLADKPESYVQSQVILTLRLLSATDISTYQFGEIKIQDLDTVIEPLGEARDYQTRIADKTYLVLEQKFALFPQQSGRLGIAPLLAEVRLPSRSSFDPFQTGGKIRRMRSQQLYIEVKPVPAEVNAAIWLPANKIELREEWPGNHAKLVAGEPVTRSLTVIADGLTAAQLPELALPQIDGIKQYPDQPGLQNNRSSKGITGLRVQKVALIPGAAGKYRLPEISLHWWNLHSGKMETAVIAARELNVTAAPVAVSSEPTVPALQTSEPAVVGTPRARFWLWLSLFLACGWGLSALYWWSSLRRRQRPISAAAGQLSLSRARKTLKQACRDNDAARARAELLPWGQALLAPRRVANLHQLGVLLGAELRLEIERLNQILYAPTNATWQGDVMWDVCRRLQQHHEPGQREVHADLAPLNP